MPIQNGHIAKTRGGRIMSQDVKLTQDVKICCNSSFSWNILTSFYLQITSSRIALYIDGPENASTSQRYFLVSVLLTSIIIRVAFSFTLILKRDLNVSNTSGLPDITLLPITCEFIPSNRLHCTIRNLPPPRS